MFNNITILYILIKRSSIRTPTRVPQKYSRQYIFNLFKFSYINIILINIIGDKKRIFTVLENLIAELLLFIAYMLRQLMTSCFSVGQTAMKI